MPSTTQEKTPPISRNGLCAVKGCGGKPDVVRFTSGGSAIVYCAAHGAEADENFGK